jgi:hypothetical protein
MMLNLNVVESMWTLLKEFFIFLFFDNILILLAYTALNFYFFIMNARENKEIYTRTEVFISFEPILTLQYLANAC